MVDEFKTTCLCDELDKFYKIMILRKIKNIWFSKIKFGYVMDLLILTRKRPIWQDKVKYMKRTKKLNDYLIIYDEGLTIRGRCKCKEERHDGELWWCRTQHSGVWL